VVGLGVTHGDRRLGRDAFGEEHTRSGSVVEPTSTRRSSRASNWPRPSGETMMVITAEPPHPTGGADWPPEATGPWIGDDFVLQPVPDAETAIKAAIKKFDIEDPEHRDRLAARRIVMAEGSWRAGRALGSCKGPGRERRKPPVFCGGFRPDWGAVWRGPLEWGSGPPSFQRAPVMLVSVRSRPLSYFPAAAVSVAS
jgi:hypothetical protein